MLKIPFWCPSCGKPTQNVDNDYYAAHGICAECYFVCEDKPGFADMDQFEKQKLAKSLHEQKCARGVA